MKRIISKIGWAALLALAGCSLQMTSMDRTPSSLPPVPISGNTRAPGDEPPIITTANGPVNAPIPGGAQRAQAPVITYIGNSN